MRSVVVLGAVLAASLVATYVSWFEEEEVAATKGETVELYAAAPGDVTGLRWTSKKLTVDVERRSDDLGDYLWVKAVSRKPKKEDKKDPAKAPEPGVNGPDAPTAEAKPADGADPVAEGADKAADKPAEPEEEMVEETIEFRGNDAADKLWESFGPLVALRELFPDANVDTSVFKFEEPDATVMVLKRSGNVDLTVGGEAWGSKDRYVRTGTRTFLVDDNALRPLQFAQMRLMERNLVPFEEEATESVVVTTPKGTQVTWQHKNLDDPSKAFWARSDKPDATDAAGSVWLAKLYKMRGAEYVAGGQPSVPTEPVFTYAMTAAGKTWSVEVIKESGNEKGDWWARSAYDRALLRLTRSIASDTAADLEGVLAGDVPDEGPVEDAPTENPPT